MAEHSVKETMSTVSEYIGEKVKDGLGAKEDVFRYTTMPEASEDYLGKCVQYVGTSANKIIHNHFYECVAKTETVEVDGEEVETTTYVWEETKVQASESGERGIYVRIDDGIRPYIKFSTSDIPLFSECTPEQLADIAHLYYTGALSLSEIQEVWKVGDSMTLPISAMSAEYVGESHAAQDVTMYIADFEHDDLTTPVNGKAKAFMTFSFILAENGQMKTTGSDAGGTSHGNEGGWASSERRSWCNDTCFNALPSALKDIIKSVDKVTDKGSCSQETNITSDKLFLPSSKELTGEIKYPSALDVSVYAGADEGTQYEMYKEDYPAQKTVYTSVTTGGKKSSWSYTYTSSYWLTMTSSKNGDYSRGDNVQGLFIHGCI